MQMPSGRKKPDGICGKKTGKMRGKYVVVSVSPTVVVFCALGLATLLAGSQWYVNEPDAPDWALRLELPPYCTTMGLADAVGAGISYTVTVMFFVLLQGVPGFWAVSTTG